MDLLALHGVQLFSGLQSAPGDSHACMSPIARPAPSCACDAREAVDTRCKKDARPFEREESSPAETHQAGRKDVHPRIWRSTAPVMGLVCLPGRTESSKMDAVCSRGPTRRMIRPYDCHQAVLAILSRRLLSLPSMSYRSLSSSARSCCSLLVSF